MKKTKLTTYFICTLLICGTIGAGCSTLLTKTASPTSLPVQMGAATTNDVELVAFEKEIQVLNSTLNPTSTNAPLNTIMGAIIALTSSFAGWMGRHKAGTSAPPPA